MIQTNPPSPHKIHAVVLTEGAWCIAQCLEYDIATRARSFSALYYEVERIIAAHIVLAQQHGREPFANIPKAPKRFWQLYKDANVKLNPVQRVVFIDPSPVSVELRVV